MPKKSSKNPDNSSPKTGPSTLLHSLMLGTVGHAATMGWSPAALTAAGTELGLSTEQAAALYPNGIDDVISRFSRHIDTLMSDKLASQNLEELRVRDRVQTAILTRLEILSPYRLAARNLLTVELARPRRAALATGLLARTVDDIWHAVGDQSTGFSYYSRRATLGLIYGSVMLFWFQDQSPDYTRTAAFLERRIDDLMQTSKKISMAKNTIQEAVQLKKPRWPRIDRLCRNKNMSTE